MYNHPHLYQSSVSIRRHFFSANPSPIYYYGSVVYLYTPSLTLKSQQLLQATIKILIDIDRDILTGHQGIGTLHAS